MDEDNLSSKEKAVPEFFLASFGKNHLKNIIGVNTDVARRHLGHFFVTSIFLLVIFLLLSLYSVTDFRLSCRRDGSQKHNGQVTLEDTKEASQSGSNSPRSIGSEDPRFFPTLGSSTFEVQPQKIHKEKKATKRRRNS